MKIRTLFPIVLSVFYTCAPPDNSWSSIQQGTLSIVPHLTYTNMSRLDSAAVAVELQGSEPFLSESVDRRSLTFGELTPEGVHLLETIPEPFWPFDLASLQADMTLWRSTVWDDIVGKGNGYQEINATLQWQVEGTLLRILLPSLDPAHSYLLATDGIYSLNLYRFLPLALVLTLP